MFRSPFWRSSSVGAESDLEKDSTLVKMASMLKHRRRSVSEISESQESEPEKDAAQLQRVLPGGGIGNGGAEEQPSAANNAADVPPVTDSDARAKADEASNTVPTWAGPASAYVRGRSQARNQQPQQIEAASKSCSSCDKKFTLFTRKRQCQNCQMFFCTKCAPTGYFSRERICIDCLSKHAKDFRPHADTTCCSGSQSRMASESVIRREVVDMKSSEGRLDIRDLDRKGVKLPWEFDGPIPQSIFRVVDREIALNLSIADVKCTFYKQQLKVSEGCACHPHLKNMDRIQTVEFPLSSPSWCSSIRLDMQFTERSPTMYVCVRVASRDTYFTGIVKVEVKQVQRSLAEGEIVFVDDLCVSCVNVSNPDDPNDSLTVVGSFAWKLYDDSRGSGKICAVKTAEPFPSSPKESQGDHGHSADIFTVRTALHKSRSKLLAEHDHAVRDEGTFLDQFNKFEKELQCRSNSMAGEGEVTDVDGGEPPAHLKLSTDELSTQDLKLAKDAAWCQKEQMTFQRRRLAMLADQTGTLKAILGTIKSSSATLRSESESVVENLSLSIPCPTCGLSIQCKLS